MSTTAADDAVAPRVRWRGNRHFSVRHAQAVQWWRVAPDNLRGSVLILASFAAFAVMTASMKAIGESVPLPQILVIRQLIMMVLLAPLFLPDVSAALETRHLGLQLMRGLCSLGAMLCGFTALFHVPLADVTALGFSRVLFVTVAAVVVLREIVGPRRWIATAIGFVGVLVMLRPGEGALDPFALLALAGALFGSGMSISVRMLAHAERTATILLYQAIILLAALLPPTIQWWQSPTAHQWGLLVLIGVFGSAGQYLITRAYQVGEAAALAPLDFLWLLVAVAIGYLLFAEVPDPVSLLGAALVVGATIYTMRRNAARRVPLPPAEP